MAGWNLACRWREADSNHESIMRNTILYLACTVELAFVILETRFLSRAAGSIQSELTAAAVAQDTAEEEAVAAVGQDTAQEEAAAAVVDVCASRSGASFLVESALLNLVTPLLQHSARSGNGEGLHPTAAYSQRK